MTSTASKLYPTTHTGAKKRKETNLTHAAGGGAKVAQQQKPAAKSTRAPQNAAKK